MATEIERKFLIKPAAWKPTNLGIAYRRGYLSSVEEREHKPAGAAPTCTISNWRPISQQLASSAALFGKIGL